MMNELRSSKSQSGSFQWIWRSRPALLCVFLALACGSVRSQESGPGEPPGGGLAIQSWDDQRDWVTSLAFLKDGRHLCVGTYEELLLRDARGAESPKSLPLRPDT